VEMRQIGVAVKYVDVGGGLGWTMTGRAPPVGERQLQCREYANDIVYALAEACQRERSADAAHHQRERAYHRAPRPPP